MLVLLLLLFGAAGLGAVDILSVVSKRVCVCARECGCLVMLFSHHWNFV